MVFLFAVTLSIPSFGEDEYQALQSWADSNSIKIIGIDQNSKNIIGDLENSKIPLKEVAGVIDSSKILYQLPDNIISSISGKTIYFSTEEGRGLSIIYSLYDTPPGIPEGIILEQPINQYYLAHEIGHFVYLDEDQLMNKNNKINSLKKSLFEIKYDQENKIDQGFVSSYAITNHHENFAEHFAFYVVNSEKFREMAQSDSLLKEKYNFLKHYIFDGIEY